MKLYEICVIVTIILVAGVTFKIRITDLTIFERFNIKKLNIDFRSANILTHIKSALKNVRKIRIKSLLYLKQKRVADEKTQNKT